MAKADTSVSHFRHSQAGAPGLSGQAGKLLDVFRAVLVTGYGLSSVDSAVIAGNVCTLTIAAGHSQIVDGVCEVAGATTPAALNGRWKVKAATATTVTFDMDAIADQTATGAITVKVASLGWSEPFSGTNIACFKSVDVAATGHYFRLDDTTAQVPRLVGYVSMTGVSTGTEPFPTDVQVPGGAYWPKSGEASAVLRPWVAWGDSRGVYFAIGPNELASSPVPVNLTPLFFGDTAALLASDLFASMVQGGQSNVMNSTGSAPSCAFNTGGAQSSSWAPRAYYNLGTAFQADTRHDWSPTYQASGVSSYGTPFPPLDGKLLLGGVSVYDTTTVTTGARRAVMPGIFTTPQAAGTSFPSFTLVSGLTGELAAKHVMAVQDGPPAYSQGGNGQVGVGFVDITGPWR